MSEKPQELVHWHGIKDEYNDGWRLWFSMNDGDQFDIVSYENYPIWRQAKHVPIIEFVDLDEQEECPICEHNKEVTKSIKKQRRGRKK